MSQLCHSTPPEQPHCSLPAHTLQAQFPEPVPNGNFQHSFSGTKLKKRLPFLVPNSKPVPGDSKPEVPGFSGTKLPSGASFFFIPFPRVSPPAITDHLAIQSSSQPSTTPPSIFGPCGQLSIHLCTYLSISLLICPLVCLFCTCKHSYQSHKDPYQKPSSKELLPHSHSKSL